MFKDDLVRELNDALNHCPAKVRGSCDWCEFNRDGICLVHESLKYIVGKADNDSALQDDYDRLKKDYVAVTSSLRSERDELDAFIRSLTYMVTDFGVDINKHEGGIYTIVRDFKPDSAKDILEEIEGL